MDPDEIPLVKINYPRDYVTYFAESRKGNEKSCLTSRDFDESKKAWRSNKKLIGREFYYTCNYFSTKTEKRCNKTIKLPSGNYSTDHPELNKVNKSKNFCYKHQNRE